MIHNITDLFGTWLHGEKESYDISDIDTVRRELKEETNLDANKIVYLNWIFKYDCLGTNCVEKAYCSFVDEGIVVLNEESTEYKWCDLDEFIKDIQWYSDKEILKRVLVQILGNGDSYFKEEKIENI